MAFLDPSKQQDPTQAGAQGNAAAGSPPTVSGGGGADVGGVSTAGVGAGGTGNFTNIQAYLNANQGNTAAADNLKSTVGGQFDQEKSNLDNQSGQALQAAQGLMDKSLTKDQASGLVDQASQAYNYSGPQSDQYNGYVSQVQGALNNPWSAPSSFSYGLGADTQNYANDLKDNQGFSSLMHNIYSKASATPLTSGQATLQDQFDTNNGALNQARQDLQGKFSGLQDYLNQTNQNTNRTLANDATQYANNQADVKAYLGGQNDALRGQISAEEQNAKDAYQNAYANNNSSVGDLLSYARQGLDNSANFTDYNIAGRMYTGPQYSNGFHWSDAQGLLNGGYHFVDPYNADLLTGKGDSSVLKDYLNAREASWRPQAQAALNNFYNQQDQTYANTADAEKRKFNAVQDFLGTQNAREQQGFKVRG